MGEVQRRLSAIMFSDIVGYSKMMGEDERGTLALLEEHNALLVPIIRRHNGAVLKYIGDAILASYDSASDAVNCGVAMQKALAARNKAKPADNAIRVRIGIHIGDVAEKDGDVFGDGVNIAARIQPLADPGGICISQTVYHIVRAQREIRMVSLGPRELKNIKESVHLYKVSLDEAGPTAAREERAGRRPGTARLAAAGAVAVLLAAGAWRARRLLPLAGGARPAASEAGRFTLLVAPFYGRDPESTREGEVMQSLIERKLYEIFGPDPQVRVLGKGAAGPARSREEARALGEKAGAALVIWGEVLTLRGEVEIQPYLTEARAQGYNWNLLAGALQSTVEESEQLKLRRAKADEVGNLAALAAARYYGDKDKEKALALLGRIAPPSAESLASQGYILYQWGTFDEAESLFRKALALDPRYARAYNGLGSAYRARGRRPEAVEQYRKAARLDPSYTAPYYNLGLTYYAQGRYDDAVTALQAALARDPGSGKSRFFLANIRDQLGRYEQAAADYRLLIEQFPQNKYAAYDALLQFVALSRAGKEDDGSAYLRSFLARAEASSETRGQWPMPLLRVYAGSLGEEQVLGSQELARGKNRACDAYYYFGMLHLTRARGSGPGRAAELEKARALLRRCVDTGLEKRVEYGRAKLELERLSRPGRL